MVLSSGIDLDLLVPGTAQQLIFSQQEVSLVLVVASRFGESKLGSPDAVMASLFPLGKVELQPARLAIDAGTDSLHHVGPTVLAKEPLHVVVGFVFKVLVGQMDLETGPAAHHPCF